MKRSLLLPLVCLALVHAPSSAREPKAPPSPSADGMGTGAIRSGNDGSSLFVGHYGEVIELPPGWTAEAEMRDETEAVYFHPKSQDEFGFEPFQPNKSDYKPENFSRMGLVELIVIPKNAPGGLNSLSAIRSAKEQELKQAGAVYQFLNETGNGDWPRDTFHISAEKPHRLWQTYAESPKEFYILTTGGHLETGDYALDERRIRDYSSALQVIDRSLSEYLRLVQKRSTSGFLFHFQQESEDDLLSNFRDYLTDSNSPFPPVVIVIVGAFMALLSFWPGRTTKIRRVRLFGRSLMLFTFLTAFAGFLVVYLPARIAGVSWNSNELALLIPVMILPGISWMAARRLGSVRSKRVLVSTGSLAALCGGLMLWGADLKNVDPPGVVALENTLMLLIIGLPFGVAFGLSFGPLPKREASR